MYEMTKMRGPRVTVATMLYTDVGDIHLIGTLFVMQRALVLCPEKRPCIFSLF